MTTILDKVKLPGEYLKEKEPSKLGEAKSEIKSELFTSLSENIKENKLFLKMKEWWVDLSFSDQEKVYKMGKSADPLGITPGMFNISPSIYSIFKHVKSISDFSDPKLKIFANEISFTLRIWVQMNLLEMKLGDGETKEQQVEKIKKDIKLDSSRVDRYKWLLKNAIIYFIPEAKSAKGEIEILDKLTKSELENFKNFLIDQQLLRLEDKTDLKGKIIDLNAKKIKKAA